MHSGLLHRDGYAGGSDGPIDVESADHRAQEQKRGGFVIPRAGSTRAQHEIAHGKRLAAADPEAVWGWATPAGQMRARRRAEIIAQGAELKPGAHVLEIGCGTGMFTEMFARTGARLVAVDISPDLLERARRRGLPPDQVQFLEKRFEDCDVDGPFDAVIGSSVLHHLEIAPALAKIHSLLSPGGWLSFAEPNMLNPQVFVERTFKPWYVSEDETAFVRWKLKKLLSAGAFEEIRITPLDWLHPSTPAALVGAVRVLGRALESAPLLREFSGSLYIRARRSHER